MDKKNILILKGDRPNTSDTGSYFTWENLKRLNQDEYFLENYSDIIITIIDGNVQFVSAVTGRDLASYDLVYIRDITHEEVRNALAMYLTHHQKKYINNELGRSQYTSKLLQYVALGLAGLPVPNTVYASAVHREKASYLLGDYPLVAKSTTGSNGSDNFLVSTVYELNKINPHGAFVLQSFIPNLYDYRIIVADDDILLGYKRIRRDESDYLNNVSMGATRELVQEIDDDIRTTAIAAAKILGRNLSGVDILQNKETGRYVILEVNFNYGSPRFESHILNNYFEKLAAYLNKKAIE
jgi:glutathione synthase/RimK-type ligase-like ATP-grasp enzyme